MGKLLRLLLIFGPTIFRAYQRHQRTQRQQAPRHSPPPRGGSRQQPRGKRTPPPPPVPDNSSFMKSASKKYKDYDYKGAIEDFKKALQLNPKDKAAHFNIACCYSLMEDVTKSFIHLDQAVANGFKDFDRIKTHDGLAHLRVQKRFLSFEKNGFRLVKD